MLKLTAAALLSVLLASCAEKTAPRDDLETRAAAYRKACEQNFSL